MVSISFLNQIECNLPGIWPNLVCFEFISLISVSYTIPNYISKKKFKKSN